MAKVDAVQEGTIPAKSQLFYLINQSYDELKINIVDQLNDSSRGSGGFGSTGNGIKKTDDKLFKFK